MFRTDSHIGATRNGSIGACVVVVYNRLVPRRAPEMMGIFPAKQP
jgi:hypothetical protein